MVTPYKGVLTLKKMPRDVYKAYTSWSEQHVRCKRAGWTIGYTSREFIGWWLEELKKRPRWRRPTAGRIDHSKGYFFENIRLEEQSENSRERIQRCGNPCMRREVLSKDTSGRVKIFESARAAGRHWGFSIATVCNDANGVTQKTARGVRFTWR